MRMHMHTRTCVYMYMHAYSGRPLNRRSGSVEKLGEDGDGDGDEDEDEGRARKDGSRIARTKHSVAQRESNR